MVNAANAASVAEGPLTLPSISICWSILQCFSPGTRRTNCGSSTQPWTNATALSIESAVPEILELVEIRRNAMMVCQGIPTKSDPEKIPLIVALAALWSAARVSWA